MKFCKTAVAGVKAIAVFVFDKGNFLVSSEGILTFENI